VFLESFMLVIGATSSEGFLVLLCSCLFGIFYAFIHELFLRPLTLCGMRYGDGAGNTVEENFGVSSLIRMR